MGEVSRPRDTRLGRDVAANPTISRRRFLGASSGSVAAALLSPLARFAAAQPPVEDGRFVRMLPLGDPWRPDNAPLNQLLGAGLDARLFTDLSSLTSGDLITPNERFFVRTACPTRVDGTRIWTVALGGRVWRPQRLRADALARSTAPMGTHLLECAGNSNANNYGLMSAARWDGVPIGALLDRAGPLPGASHVRVSGVDDEGVWSRTSTPGASWIFSRDDLERARAFLATRMNGEALPRHHGAPVRLVVPGWYACTCIKWVNRIDLVSSAHEATSQMVEFAGRTHQSTGGARLARDFAPAAIDTAATPIRVEQWDVAGRPAYRIIGLVWGGSTPVDALQIRFRTGDPWVDITGSPRPDPAATWRLWSHQWRPPEAGRYHIVVRVKDPGIRTRRLDLFFYVRAVDVTDV